MDHSTDVRSLLDKRFAFQKGIRLWLWLVEVDHVRPLEYQHFNIKHLGKEEVEACPFAGIIQIKFNGISQNESCRSNHRTPVMLIPKLTTYHLSSNRNSVNTPLASDL
jgi:hypothetical protein